MLSFRPNVGTAMDRAFAGRGFPRMAQTKGNSNMIDVYFPIDARISYGSARYFLQRYIETGNEMHRVRAVRWQRIAAWQSLMLRKERGIEQ